MSWQFSKIRSVAKRNVDIFLNWICQGQNEKNLKKFLA